MGRLCFILICVLLGAATTVGVAWCVPHAHDPILVATELGEGLTAEVPGMRVSYDAYRADAHSTMVGYNRIEVGLPLFALAYQPHPSDWGDGPDPPVYRPPAAFVLDDILPFRPIPLGFTIDTAFYGALWFGMIVCPGFVRRRRRATRGLCPSCGYDMRGSDGVCPECGR